MRKKYFGLFLIGFIIFSCKVQINSLNYKDFEITQQSSYFFGKQHLVFSVKNISKQPLTLFDPLLIKIEYKIYSNWKNIRTLYCPCGASCPRPPEEIILQNNEIHQFNWNMVEEWCGKINKYGIPDTMSSEAKPGIYRLKIGYKLQNTNRISIYYQFEID